MTHKFLLDENILYHAIRGVDRHDNPDDTAARLILTIVEVCHSLIIHNNLMVRYLKILSKLRHERSLYFHIELGDFFRQALVRADKRTLQYDDLPKLPAGCNIPRKDEYLVQAALIPRPLLVTADEPLYNAVRSCQGLEIEILWPHEALERARERPRG